MKSIIKMSFLLFLLLAFILCLQAQKRGRWASARERGLRGPVRTVIERCSNVGASLKYGHKYEFARDGKLIVITSLQIDRPAYNVSYPSSHKITKRNSRGDVTEASFFTGGELERRERYDIEYDSVGNWTKRVTYIMKEYEVEGSDTAGKWLAQYTCIREIDYYP
jgi:hypothetical protein